MAQLCTTALALALLIATALPAIAQNQSTQALEQSVDQLAAPNDNVADELDQVEVPELNTENGVFLSLRDVVALTLNNNPNIKISKLDVEIATDDVQGAKGIYDPLFTGFIERSSAEVATGIISSSEGSADSSFASLGFSTDDVQKTEQQNAGIAIQQLLPTSTQLEIKLHEQSNRF